LAFLPSFSAMRKRRAGLGRNPKSNCLPIKCERGTKCYFVPRALKSPLTNSRPPFFLGVAVQSSTRIIVHSMIFQI
ncbi:hypothetical protein, partial [Candidatus Avelusimicrobium faecicola]|uniref:hypothetical protein n=1 Tax=Candidatus Avelusimicrobium faecicola TaxID=3416205 RepID=UPI003D09B44B